MALIVLTGACGGIGTAIARRLAGNYQILGIDRESSGDWRGDFLRLNLNSEAAVETASAEIVGRKVPISALIFAAGTYRRYPIARYDLASLNEIMWDNFTSIFFLLKGLLPHMVENGGGRIVLISSQAGATGGLDAGYAASKAAAVALMKSVAREFGPFGIRCNAVSPGPVTTPMADVMGDARKEYYAHSIPIGRLGTADEVAEVVAFLATSAVDGLNGATIDVDGGLVRR